MTRLLSLLLLLLAGTIANAQSPDDAIKTTVNQLFTAMRNADSSILRACFAPGARLQSVVTDKTTGKEIIETTSVDDFAAIVARMPKNAADERIVFGNILIDGSMASVWTPYRFYFKEQYSHCGVDSYQLVKVNGTWKILYLLDTRRKENCPEGAR